MIEDLKQALLDGMIEYMMDGSPGYTQEHIDKCGKILDVYLGSIAVASDEEAARECVKDAVLELNNLNPQAGESLIETGEREQLWEIVTRAGTDRGFFRNDEDITEAWREW